MKHKNDIRATLNILGVKYSLVGMSLNDIEYIKTLYKAHLAKGILNIDNIIYQLVAFGKLDKADAVKLVNYWKRIYG